MAGDASWGGVLSLLHFDGISGGISFPDTAGRTWTRAGGAQLSSAQAKFGPTSLLLNGSTDYLNCTDAGYSGFSSLTSWTLEAFVRLSAFSANQALFGMGDSSSNYFQCMFDTANGLRINTAAGDVLTQGNTSGLSTGAWLHIAFCRSGANLYAFIGGVLVASSASGASMPAVSSQLMRVGANVVPASFLNGYVDEARITKGVARYTAAFTPPAAPFADGMGQVSGTVKDSAGAAAARFVRAYRRDTGAVVAERHSVAGDANLYYVSTLVRVNLGSVVDSSFIPKAYTNSGTVKTNNTVRKFSLASMQFDGSSAYLQTPAVADFLLGAGDFTAEAWINPISNTTGKVCGVWSDTSASGFSWKLELASGTLQFVYSTTGGNNTTLTASASAVPANAWSHVCAMRTGGTLYLFVNGVVVGSAAVSATFFAVASTKLFEIGRDGAGATDYFNGYMDDVRLTKGLARYATAGFTPPTDRFADHLSGALGDYSFYTPTLDELTLLALDNATSGTIYDDICERVIPA